jgi:serine/threonine-protein kinase RsbW
MGLTEDSRNLPAHAAGARATVCERVFPARLDALPELTAFVAEAGARADVPSGSCQRLSLLVEELFTNTIEHGHRRETDEPVIVGLRIEPGWITLTYEDTAPPHNPFEDIRPPDDTADVEERPVGGLGVLLVAAMARDVEYHRAGDRNRIRLVMAPPA